MVTLRDITYSREYNRTHYGVDRAEQTSALYWPSLDAALRAIYRLGNVVPGVRQPVGGARTKKQCNDLGLSWTVSDHWEGRPARAVDIDNRGAVIAGIAAKQRVSFWSATNLYYKTFASFGWRNITTDNLPFGREPWHLANHSTHPAGSPGVPLPGTPPAPKPPTIENEDDSMSAIYYADTNSVGNDITADTAPRTPGKVITLPGGAGQHTVNAQASYFQEGPGAPLKQLTPGALFVPNATADYVEPAGAALERTVFVAGGGYVKDCKVDELAALIALRGLTG